MRAADALAQVTGEFYVGIDADTVIAPTPSASSSPTLKTRSSAPSPETPRSAIASSLDPLAGPRIHHSQNFERRALDLFNVVTVVPGAIGAWRTAPVKAAGGYPSTPSPKTPTSP